MALTQSQSARLLRAALKAAGFNARRVTLRQSHSTLRITIRDAWVSITQVQAIAAPFEQVQRCHLTGEILSGGNLFIEVRYDETVVAPVQAAILVVLGPAPEDEMVSVLGEFRAAKISRRCGATYPNEIRLVGPGLADNEIACGLGFAAKRLAIAYLDACGQTEGAAVR